MGKSKVEQKLRDAEGVLEKIRRALESHPDRTLSRLGHEAKDAADDVRDARKDVHSHWDD